MIKMKEMWIKVNSKEQVKRNNVLQLLIIFSKEKCKLKNIFLNEKHVLLHERRNYIQCNNKIRLKMLTEEKYQLSEIKMLNKREILTL